MIGQVIEVADKVLGKFIPDKNLKNEATKRNDYGVSRR